MKDDSFFRGIRGPVGSGKSVACCVEVFRRALSQKKNEKGIRKSRWAIIRNTNPQLRTTTIKTWLDWFPETTWGNFRWEVPYTHYIRKGEVDLEVIFLALDRPEDVKKLLSLELTGVWINEARELPKSIVDACTMRVGRFPSMREGGPSWTGVICDTNAPEEDHWWAIMSGEVPIPDQASFIIKPTESHQLDLLPSPQEAIVEVIPEEHFREQSQSPILEENEYMSDSEEKSLVLTPHLENGVQDNTDVVNSTKNEEDLPHEEVVMESKQAEVNIIEGDDVIETTEEDHNGSKANDINLSEQPTIQDLQELLDPQNKFLMFSNSSDCLLYTSDAADE